jgi:N-acetylglucosamine kinase-like BadF-type ATPase
MTNKKLYLEVKEKVPDEEIVACDGMRNKKLFSEAKEKVSEEEIVDLIEDTAEESAIKLHAHSSEVASAQEDDASAMSILDQIMQNMEKEKEYEKVMMAAKRKEMEQKQMSYDVTGYGSK